MKKNVVIVITLLVILLTGCVLETNISKTPKLTEYVFSDEEMELMRLLDLHLNKYVYHFENVSDYKSVKYTFEEYTIEGGYAELGNISTSLNGNDSGNLAFLVDINTNRLTISTTGEGLGGSYSIIESFFNDEDEIDSITSYYRTGDIEISESDEMVVGIVFESSSESSLWSHRGYNGDLENLLENPSEIGEIDKVLVMKCQFNK